MTISIVTAALITQPGRPTVADDATGRATRADEASFASDFFSILLAQPAMTASAARPATEVADSPQPAAEDAAPAAVEAEAPNAAVEMLVLGQPLPQTTYRPPPAVVSGGDGERIAGPVPTAGETLAALPPAHGAPGAAEPVRPTAESRQLPAAATDAGPKAATFAVADLAVLAREQTAPEKAEPLAPTLPAHAAATPAGIGSAAVGAPPTPTAAAHTLQTPLRDPSWASEFGEKLLWFANNEQQGARITVHPPQLGVIEISLRLDRDGATAHFASPNAEVRGAIEAAMPRLREMFASAGIDIGQLSVGSQSLGDQSHGQRDSSPATHRLPDAAILGSDPPPGVFLLPAATRHGQAMIDVFA
ncbi:MAG TPA: flagellar hook-length control protein FliK [Accumulibacter sp.]|uniref:flagellar hook-length control protein FliK n=1 Tax=Accumulibacter sp. TaxID=2053492 RepID=UPI002C108DC7|nr:flagellar hook-length control protein FliK [Accumulibacter sp.]HRD88521.1 flagellar hook-length control protein FliK [Accumulibacter sp.]